MSIEAPSADRGLIGLPPDGHEQIPGEPGAKKPSPAQLAANRRNAQKSTGPKTPEGRAVSKMNALKHGLLSRQVLVRGWTHKESGRALSALHDRFRRELNPVGPVEEMLVDQIVTTQWRLRRALQAESGEIAWSVDHGQWQRSRPNVRLHWVYWEQSDDPVSAMKESALGTSILAAWLRHVRERVEEEGELTEAAVKIPFDGKPNRLSEELEAERLRLSQNPVGADADRQREENKNEALTWLDRKLGMLHWCKAACVERETLEETARQAASILPAPEILDKILRYETKLERQLYRALNQLERLQRLRRGEAVPPPLTLEVSERA